MISKLFIIAAIFGLFPGSSYQDSDAALIAGLEYALTQSNIVEPYGHLTISDKEECAKVVVVNSSKNMEKSTAAYFNESDICIASMEKQGLFFLSIKEYFEVEKLAGDAKGYSLTLQLITPEYGPSANEQMFWVLKYSITEGLINVQSFDKVVQINK